MAYFGQSKKSSFIIRSLLLAACAYPLSGFAADPPGTPLGPPFSVPTTIAPGSSLDWPSTARTANGNFVVVGEEDSIPNGGTGPLTCYGQLFDASGSRIGTQFLIDQVTSPGYVACQVAMDANGNFVVFARTTSDLKTYDLYAYRYAADGTALGGPIHVTTVAPPSGVSVSEAYLTPMISVNSGGDFVIAWDYWYAHPLGAIFDTVTNTATAQIYGNDGVAKTAPFTVVPTTVSYGGGNHPAIPTTLDAVAMAPNGNVVFVGEHYDVQAQIFDETGTALAGMIRVSNLGRPSSAYNQPRQPTVGVDAQGNFVVAWESAWNTSQSGINRAAYARRYNAAGKPQGPIITETSSAFADANDLSPSPTISVDASGQFLLTWTDGNDAQAFQNGQYYNPDGSTLGAAFTFTAYPSNVAVDATGNMVAVWYSDLSTAPTMDAQLFTGP